MRQCLLLNASHEVLRVIPMNRAVVLVIQQKAEIVEAGSEYVRSESLTMPMPAVIRLKYYVKLPWNAKVALNRKNLMLRDGHECQVAGCDRVGNTIDHIKPRALGGLHRWDNVTLMCSNHNQKKGIRSLKDLGWKLKSVPTVPKGGVIIVGVAGIDPLWEPHLTYASVA